MKENDRKDSYHQISTGCKTSSFLRTGKFQSDIKIAIDNKKVSAKSIMGIIALEMAEGQRANILAEGSDEEAAVNELAAALS